MKTFAQATGGGVKHSHSKGLQGLIRLKTLSVNILNRFKLPAERVIPDSKVSIVGFGTKVGFTLAEVLIVIGVIGFVAVAVIPTLVSHFHEKVRAEQVRMVKYKFTKATEQMNSLGLLTGYQSTEDFLDELEKYFKISKICTNEKLRECWPYDAIKLTDGTKYSITKIKNGASFKKTKGDWSSPVMGIVTGDGHPMLLTYRKDCEPLDNIMYPWSTSGGKPVTNATADCVSAIFEINGASGKNQFKQDVNAFNVNGLGTDCTTGTPMGSRCFGDIQSATYVRGQKCIEMQNTGKYGNLKCSSGNGTDYWAGAAIACGGANNLPSDAEAKALLSKVYGITVDRNKTYTGVEYDSKKAQELGLPANAGYTIWLNNRNDVAKASHASFNQKSAVHAVNTYTINHAFGYMCALD